MARSTRTHLPEDEYLLLVGQAAYMFSSLEGMVVFDLPGLAAYLQASLNAGALAGKTTGQIADALTAADGDIDDDDVRTYIALAGRLLGEASSRRNNLLHSRPASHEEGTRLYRWKMEDWREPHLAFAIDTAWLEKTIDFLSEAHVSLNAVRPLHKSSSFTPDQD